MKNWIVLLICIFCIGTLMAQRTDKLPRFLEEPIMADSSSTIMIPVRYNEDLLSSSKLALGNDFYANIIFYNFITDSTKRLFEDDTFIKGFSGYQHSLYYDRSAKKEKRMTGKWIFYFVKAVDFDNNGRIDTTDPSVLYASDKYGNQLQPISPPNENAVSIELYEKQGFALIKMQRDMDKDRDFEFNDKDYYYLRLDLNTLATGRKIEVR